MVNSAIKLQMRHLLLRFCLFVNCWANWIDASTTGWLLSEKTEKRQMTNGRVTLHYANFRAHSSLIKQWESPEKTCSSNFKWGMGWPWKRDVDCRTQQSKSFVQRQEQLTCNCYEILNSCLNLDSQYYILYLDKSGQFSSKISLPSPIFLELRKPQPQA